MKWMKRLRKQAERRLRCDGKLQVRAGGFAWKKPLKPGKYRLFIHTKEGDLKKVEGAVVIVRSEA